MMVRRDWTDRFLLRPLTWVLPEGARLRTEEQVHAFLDGFLFLKEPASFAVIALSGVLVWFLYILMTYVALFAFGLKAGVDKSFFQLGSAFSHKVGYLDFLTLFG